MKSRAAVTLLEAIISSFLLVLVFLIFIALFHSGLNYSTRTESQQLAAMIAERQLELVRDWSETDSAGVYNFDLLGPPAYSSAPINGGLATGVSDHPGFQTITTVTRRILDSTCSTFEESVPLIPPFGVRRQITQSVKNVAVQVLWDGGSHSLSLSTLLSAPATNPTSVTITGGSPGGGLPRDQSLVFTATASDANGPLRDVFFFWNVFIRTGTGTMLQARDGSTATLYNWVYQADGTRGYVPGTLYLQASARYHGRLVTGNTTQPVTLN